jgi:hypothetical protein
VTGSMSTVLSRDGTTIGFDRLGARPAVILVGGAMSTRSAHAQRRILAGQTHGVAPDALAPVLEEIFAG